jgi:uncharacterized membrane protein (UPF0127 family)
MPRRLDRLPSIALLDGVQVVLATSLAARTLGLAGLRAPPPADVVLLLAPCRSVHTCGMRFPLDLLWLGADGRVLRVDRGVPPWRVRCCRGARAVVEARAGAAAGDVHDAPLSLALQLRIDGGSAALPAGRVAI